MKKVYRFGDEVAFISGQLSYVYYVAQNIPMNGNRIDKDKLQKFLRTLKYPPVVNSVVSIEVLIAGVDNGESYLYVFSQRNNFEKTINNAPPVGVKIWCGGIRTEECLRESEKAFNESGGEPSNTYINTYKRISCDAVGGFITVYKITPFGICKILDNYDINDDITPHDSWSYVVGVENIYSPKGRWREIHGVNGETLVGNIILGKELGIYNPMNNMKFTEDGLEITDIQKKNTFTVNPKNSNKLLKISHNGEDRFYIDENGYIHLWENDVILTEQGMNFRSDGIPIGRMVSTGLKSYPDKKGLHFTLNKDGSYMCWAAIEGEDNNIKLAYYRDGVHPNRKEGLHLECDTYISDGVNFKRYLDEASLVIADDNVFSITDKNNNRICNFNPNNIVFYKDLDMDYNSILHQSDARLKTNIETTDVNALDAINQIELKQFDWIENNKHEDIGMIAQQLQDIIPDLVHEDKDNGKLSIKTDKFIPYLIKAVQELSRKVENQNISHPALMKASRVNTNSWESISLEEKNEFVEKLKSEAMIPETNIPEPISIPVGK